MDGTWVCTTVHEDQLRGYQQSAKCILLLTKKFNNNNNQEEEPPKQQQHIVSLPHHHDNNHKNSNNNNNNKSVQQQQQQQQQYNNKYHVIDDFATLTALHHPHNEYRLMPIIAENTVAFEAMVAICRESDPNSPFSIEHHRLFPSSFRYALGYRSPGRRHFLEFLGKSEAEQDVNPKAGNLAVVDRIKFDGVLCAPGVASCCLQVHPFLTRATVATFSNAWGFLNSPFFFKGDHASKPTWARILAQPQRFPMLVSYAPFSSPAVAQEVTDYAHIEPRIGVYARDR